MTKADLIAAVARQPPQSAPMPPKIAQIVNEEDKVKMLCSIGSNSATLLPKSMCVSMGGLMK